MKTIKREAYKGYEIIAKAEYMEDTTTFYGSRFENLDSVKFEVVTKKDFLPSQVLKGSVEGEKSKRKEMYDAFNNRVEDLIETAREFIDKKEREKEITDGLPESLLKDSQEKDLTNLYFYISNKFGITPVLAAKLSEVELELFKNHKEKELEGLVDGNLKLASLHEDELILRKGDAEGDELESFSNSADISSNVEDITAQEASEYMTSVIVQWKLDAKDAMGVIDSWNEISNNCATTIEKLEIRKMQEILDEKSLAAKEEGVAIGKALKSFLTRVSDVPSVKENLKEYGINTDGTAEMTLKDLASKWSTLDDEQKKLVGVNVAGRYQLARFIVTLSELNKYKD